MIDQDQIRKLAVKYQTSELNTVREYLQHLFLSYFYQQSQAGSVYFKGGTALRFVYHSPRFSEDLDFSANYENVSEVENNLLEVLAKIEKENIQATLQEAKTTTGGYLSIIDFMVFGQQIPIRIEISFREKKNKGDLVTITSDFIPPYTMMVLTKDQLIAQKMQALQARKKARDFYDLYFILRKQLPILGKGLILKEALAALRSSHINFDRELKQFLPKTHWLIIKDFKHTLEQEIKSSV